jgi:hypothetical protein
MSDAPSTKRFKNVCILCFVENYNEHMLHYSFLKLLVIARGTTTDRRQYGQYQWTNQQGKAPDGSNLAGTGPDYGRWVPQR